MPVLSSKQSRSGTQQRNQLWMSCLLSTLVLSLLHQNVFCQEITTETTSERPVSADDPWGLAYLRDDYWLTAEDNAAYYGLLARARDQDATELSEQAAKFIAERREKSRLSTFVDIIRNTKAFRGQPVQMQGHVLQTIEYEAIENDHGIEKLYESILFTEDSQSHPTTVVFLEKPDNLPVGGELINGVTVNGYFLKTYLYPSSDNTTRKTPLILAHTVTVRPQPVEAKPGGASFIVYAAIGACFVVLMILVVAVQRSDRKRGLENQKKRLEMETPRFDQ